MKLMVKGGVKRFVPDCGVEFYRGKGFVVEGEESPSIPAQPVAAKADAAAKSAEKQADVLPEPATGEDKSFTCPHCGKSYRKESALRKHISEKHPE